MSKGYHLRCTKRAMTREMRQQEISTFENPDTICLVAMLDFVSETRQLSVFIGSSQRMLDVEVISFYLVGWVVVASEIRNFKY